MNDTRHRHLKGYNEAVCKLNEGLIRTELPAGVKKPPPVRWRARINEMKRFLEALGNPQKSLFIAAVCGTSGKGSVAVGISSILRSFGLRTGLHVSPYLQSATEKICIDDVLVSGLEFARLVDWVLPVAGPLVNPFTPASIHGMASIAIALEAFRRAGTDVVIFEAGAGARYDLSSVIEPQLVVITGVSRDHVKSLGPSIEDIAFHKSGMIRRGVHTVSINQPHVSEAVSRQTAASGAVPPVFSKPGPDWRTSNRNLATMAAGKILELMGRKPNPDCSDSGEADFRLPGRLEFMPRKKNGPVIIVDGAHNGEKISAVLSVVSRMKKKGRNRLVTGFLSTKKHRSMTHLLSRWADDIITTSVRVYGKQGMDPADLARIFNDASKHAKCIRDPAEAVETALDEASGDDVILVTGSMYLAGDVRSMWYPTEEIVFQQTPWPDIAK